MDRSTQLRYQWGTDNCLFERLRLSTQRLEAAQQEIIWAIAAAREQGLLICQIAVATQTRGDRHRIGCRESTV